EGGDEAAAAAAGAGRQQPDLPVEPGEQGGGGGAVHVPTPTPASGPLLLGDRLGGVNRAVVLGLGLLGVEDAQVVGRGGDVVPAAVLEVDDRLAVAVDGDDAADDAGEALQLGPLRVDLHVLVGPAALQFLVALVGGVHGGASGGPGVGA